MKTTHIVYEFDKAGGAIVAARLLIEELANRGHDVSVITTKGTPGLAVEERDGVRVLRFLPRNLYWVGEKERQPLSKRALWQLVDTWNPHVYRQVRKLLEQERPDLVHVHKLRGLSPSVWHAALRAGVGRLIHTCQDYELLSPEGTLAGRLGRAAERGRFPVSLYQRARCRASRAVAVATAPSRYTLDFHARRGMFPRAELEVVPNSHGVRASGIEGRLALGGIRRGDELVTRFLFMARLEPEKGIEVLLRAFEKASTLRGDLRLTVAGWGSLQEGIASRYADRSQIDIVGPVFGEQKETALAAADVLVLPSIWPEPFGIVIAEAYSYGKPVIVSDAGGMAELVEPEETGWVVRAGDADALAGALLAAAERLSRDRMSAACGRKAAEFAIDAVVDRYEAIYRSLLQPRRER